METNELHRGRLIDHLQLVVSDLDKSFQFYSAVFKSLGVPLGDKGQDYFWADELFVSSRESKAAAGVLTGRVHLAFQAKDRATVERFHKEGQAAGGKDNGVPGERPSYHPGYYAAFLLDPDGNNIEVVHHGPAKRSAESVKVNF